MLTNRKKLRNRKQIAIKIYIIAAVVVLSLGIGYLISVKLFVRHGYVSPLSTLAIKDTSNQNQDDSNLDLIKNSLSGQKSEVDTVKRQDAQYVVTFKDGSVVILSSEKDLKSQISFLQFILSRLTMEGKLFLQLDLRFDKPVIKLKN